MYDTNRFPSTYDELKTFYPVWYQDVLEMNAILSVQGSVLDGVINAIDLIIDNNFITTADEDTVYRLEVFLGIKTDTSKALDERRRLVLSYFVGYGKISASKIAEILTVFTEAGCEITFAPEEEGGASVLTIIVDRGEVDRLYFSDMAEILQTRLPAHIAYSFSVRYTKAVTVSSARTHTVYLYDFCGLYPEVAMIGKRKGAESVVDCRVEQTAYSSPAAQQDYLTGLYPEVAMLGEHNTANLEVGELIESTAFVNTASGTLPQSANVGVNSMVSAGVSDAPKSYTIQYAACGTGFASESS